MDPHNTGRTRIMNKGTPNTDDYTDNMAGRDRPGPSNKRARPHGGNISDTGLTKNTKRMKIDSASPATVGKKSVSAPAAAGRGEIGKLGGGSAHSTVETDPDFAEDFDDENLFRDSSFDGARKNSNGGPGTVDAGMDSDNSNNSDKFYSQIIAMEEKKKQEKESLPSVATVPSSDLKPTAKSVSDVDRSRGFSTSGSSFSDSSVSNINRKSQVHVFMKLINPSTNQVILETKEFKADIDTVVNFLKVHDVDVSNVDSGYAADASSESSVVRSIPIPSRAEGNVSSKYSLGSTITRPSDASTLSRPSDASTLNRPSVNSLASNPYMKHIARKTRVNALLSSTRVSDADEYEENDETSTKPRDATNSLTESQQEVSSPLGSKRGKKNESTNYGSNSSISNASATTMSSSLSIKSEPGTSTIRRKTKGQTERNEETALKAVETFSDPTFVKSATLWGTIWPGAAVFARWRDRVYYSGKVWKRGQNDTWHINFEDDMMDVASETHILPIKILGIGTWTVYCPSDVFKPENAIIAGQRFLDGTNDDLEKTEYALISEEDGRVIISNRKNLTILENDAREMRKQYQVTITPKAADLSVENIVVGKRDRCAKMEPTPSNQIRAMVAKLDSTSRSKSSSSDLSFATLSKPQLSDSPSIPTPTTSRKHVSTNVAPVRRNLAGPSRAKSSDDANGDDSIVSADNSGRDGSPAPRTADPSRKLSVIETDSNSGKEDEEDPAQIFAKKYFFLTASGGGVDPATSNVVVPYDKEELRGMIETCGGIVLDGVGSEGRRRKNVFLISDNYARTVKYIYALAAGISCISYTWIAESFVKQKLLDHRQYELSAGFSIEAEVVLPAHQERPLKGFQVYVTGATDELYKYWKPVLHAAGAIVPKRPHLKKGQSEPLVPSHTDVLVTDMSCSLEVWEYARDKNIPVVKPEWLVQTIIAGKRVAFDGHEKYAVTELDAPNNE